MLFSAALHAVCLINRFLQFLHLVFYHALLIPGSSFVFFSVLIRPSPVGSLLRCLIGPPFHSSLIFLFESLFSTLCYFSFSCLNFHNSFSHSLPLLLVSLYFDCGSLVSFCHPNHLPFLPPFLPFSRLPSSPPSSTRVLFPLSAREPSLPLSPPPVCTVG